jgi:hypothetical protein
MMENQLDIINDLQNDTELLTEWEVDFLTSCQERLEGDRELTLRQEEILLGLPGRVESRRYQYGSSFQR